MEFSMDVAGEALADLKEDLDYFLKSKEEREKLEIRDKKLEGGEDLDINPFAALFGLFGKKKEEKKKKGDDVVLEAKDIKKDNYVEGTMRASAISGAASALYLIYDVYKKSHAMASAPGVGFDNYDADAAENLSEGGKVRFRDAFRGRGG